MADPRQDGTADLAIVNARAWTVSGDLPTAEAVAVRGDRIVAVGSDAEIRRTVGGGTRVIDAGGKLVLPGFNDAHVHFLAGGLYLIGVQLRDAGNEEEFVGLLKDYVSGLPEGQWVTGGCWDHEAWPGQKRPTRWMIDPVTPDNPVLVHRLDGHIALANSLALRLGGVAADTANPPGGQIERDARTGKPTGILIDRAQELVRRAVPEPSDQRRLEAAQAAMRYAASVGVTSVQDMASAGDLRLYRQLRAAGRLSTRVYVALTGLTAAMAEVRAQRRGSGDPLLRTGAVKIFADGSLGAGSALLFEPYEDDPSTSGLAMHSEDELCRITEEADAAGLQVLIHAIGDRGTHLALNAFERAARRNGRRGARHRVEHAQVVRPEDRPRFAQLGVIASIQPSHCTDDMRWIEKRLGSRARNAYPFRSLLDAGARISLGTDWFVEPLDPLPSIYAAVTREFPGGGPPGGWYPQEKVSVAQAIEAYTLGSAYAEFQEAQKGSVEAGKLADLVILSRDLFTIPPGEILNTRVEMTILGGQCIYEREESVL